MAHMSKSDKRPKSMDSSKLEKISKSRDWPKSERDLRIAKTEKLPTYKSRDKAI